VRTLLTTIYILYNNYMATIIYNHNEIYRYTHTYTNADLMTEIPGASNRTE
jgi:hypothetical protein